MEKERLIINNIELDYFATGIDFYEKRNVAKFASLSTGDVFCIGSKHSRSTQVISIVFNGLTEPGNIETQYDIGKLLSLIYQLQSFPYVAIHSYRIALEYTHIDNTGSRGKLDGEAAPYLLFAVQEFKVTLNKDLNFAIIVELVLEYCEISPLGYTLKAIDKINYSEAVDENDKTIQYNYLTKEVLAVENLLLSRGYLLYTLNGMIEMIKRLNTQNGGTIIGNIESIIEDVVAIEKELKLDKGLDYLNQMYVLVNDLTIDYLNFFIRKPFYLKGFYTKEDLSTEDLGDYQYAYFSFIDDDEQVAYLAYIFNSNDIQTNDLISYIKVIEPSFSLKNHSTKDDAYPLSNIAGNFYEIKKTEVNNRPEVAIVFYPYITSTNTEGNAITPRNFNAADAALNYITVAVKNKFAPLKISGATYPVQQFVSKDQQRLDFDIDYDAAFYSKVDTLDGDTNYIVVNETKSVLEAEISSLDMFNYTYKTLNSYAFLVIENFVTNLFQPLDYINGYVYDKRSSIAASDAEGVIKSKYGFYHSNTLPLVKNKKYIAELTESDVSPASYEESRKKYVIENVFGTTENIAKLETLMNRNWSSIDDDPKILQIMQTISNVLADLFTKEEEKIYLTDFRPFFENLELYNFYKNDFEGTNIKKEIDDLLYDFFDRLVIFNFTTSQIQKHFDISLASKAYRLDAPKYTLLSNRKELFKSAYPYLNLKKVNQYYVNNIGVDNENNKEYLHGPCWPFYITPVIKDDPETIGHLKDFGILLSDIYAAESKDTKPPDKAGKFDKEPVKTIKIQRQSRTGESSGDPVDYTVTTNISELINPPFIFNPEYNAKVRYFNSFYTTMKSQDLLFPNIRVFLVYGNEDSIAQRLSSEFELNIYKEITGLLQIKIAPCSKHNPVDLAYFKVMNPSNIYSDPINYKDDEYARYIRTLLNSDAKYNSEEEAKETLERLNNANTDYGRKSIKIKAGSRIQIRAGYDSRHIDNEVIFNGIITDIGGDHILDCIAEGFGRELLLREHGTYLFNPYSNSADTQEMIYNTLFQDEVEHFGVNVPNPLGVFAGENAEVTRRKNTLTAGRSLGFDEAIGGVTFTFSNLSNLGYLLTPTNRTLNIYLKEIFLGYKGLGEKYGIRYMNYLDKELTSLYETEIFGFSFLRATWTRYVMNGTTAFQILKEMSYRYFNILGKVMLFDDRVTYFFGLKEQMYQYDRLYLVKENDAYSSDKYTKHDLVEGLQEGGSSIMSSTYTPLDKSIYANIKKRALKIEEYNRQRGYYLGELNEDTVATFENYLMSKYKPATNIHFLHSGLNIVENQLKLNADYYNVAKVGYYEAKDDYKKEDFKYIVVKADDNLIPSQHRENIYTSNGIHGEGLAYTYAGNFLVDEITNMYDGYIHIIGNPLVKPEDICYIWDEVRDMSGYFKVKEAIHFYDEDNGYQTEITPGLFIESSQVNTSIIYRALRAYYDSVGELLSEQLKIKSKLFMETTYIVNNQAADSKDKKVYLAYRNNSSYQNTWLYAGTGIASAVVTGVIARTLSGSLSALGKALGATLSPANNLKFTGIGLKAAFNIPQKKYLELIKKIDASTLGPSPGLTSIKNNLTTIRVFLLRNVALNILRNVTPRILLLGASVALGGLALLAPFVAPFILGAFLIMTNWVFGITFLLVQGLITATQERIKDLYRRQPLRLYPLKVAGKSYTSGLDGYITNTLWDSFVLNAGRTANNLNIASRAIFGALSSRYE